ncbi:hypothetical protein GA0070624_5513 [Micromonospora rhizosphaerae]|uniref:Uncharacterized protein n=1 Tax=Micromonospora rhizosphaerae TaxID=568872 RepID=A0A1C6T3Y7_9ACTN|nr:hypothetical protein GA0070624_5513 [Micromonospora rhizosphaerae]
MPPSSTADRAHDEELLVGNTICAARSHLIATHAYPARVDAGEFIALGAALLAAVVAIAVPVWTFKRTLELERIKWVRDQRAQLYIDILAEAYAEKQWFLDLMTRREITLIEERDGEERRGPSQADFPPGPDLRLGPVERSKLGARGALFASAEVSKAFNAFSGVLGRCSLIQPQSEAEAHIANVQADELFDALSTAIRNELGAGAKLNLAQPTADDAKS